MVQIRAFFKFLGRLLCHVLLSVLIGLVLLSAVRLLPAPPMEQHLAESAPVFAEEGLYPNLFPWCTSQLDSTTDALILMISACDTGENPVIQAMTGSWNSLSETNAACRQLIEHYIHGTPFTGTQPYYQYWHGYQLLIRPALMLMNYGSIRLLNGLLQTGLLLLLCWMMHKKGLGRYIPAWLAAAAMLMPLALAKSLQFSSCYYILTVSSILLLWKKDTLNTLDGLLFLYIGIATAYFDFLTYPVATLGMPAVLYFCFRQDTNIRSTFCLGVKICFSWAVGYIGMWAGKWFIGSLILQKNILVLAAEKLTERSSTDSSAGLLYSLRVALGTNLRSFFRTPASFLVVILALILMLLVIRRLKNNSLSWTSAARILFPFVILALLPMAWYAVTSQHAVIHYWFTNKSLAVSVFAGLAGLAKACKTTTA